MICAHCDGAIQGGVCKCFTYVDTDTEYVNVEKVKQAMNDRFGKHAKLTQEDYLKLAQGPLSHAAETYYMWEESESDAWADAAKKANGEENWELHAASVQGWLLGLYMGHALVASYWVEKAGMRLRLCGALLTDTAHWYWGETQHKCAPPGSHGHNMLGEVGQIDGRWIETFSDDDPRFDRLP